MKGFHFVTSYSQVWCRQLPAVQIVGWPKSWLLRSSLAVDNNSTRNNNSTRHNISNYSSSGAHCITTHYNTKQCGKWSHNKFSRLCWECYWDLSLADSSQAGTKNVLSVWLSRIQCPRRGQRSEEKWSETRNRNMPRCLGNDPGGCSSFNNRTTQSHSSKDLQFQCQHQLPRFSRLKHYNHIKHINYLFQEWWKRKLHCDKKSTTSSQTAHSQPTSVYVGLHLEGEPVLQQSWLLETWWVGWH